MGAATPDVLGFVIRETGNVLGHDTVKYVCPCGHPTTLTLVQHEADAEREMRHHLALMHSEDVGYGVCAECGQVTDWLRAASDLGDAWLCQNHAPAASLRTILGSPEATVEPQPEREPYYGTVAEWLAAQRDNKDD